MDKIFISPPFGNYFYFKNTISIKGTYTLEPRPGAITQILKTLRYSREHKGWINKIGLRNIGIKEGLKKYNYNNDIISIGILEDNEINNFNTIIPKDINLELNISCPNLDKSLIQKDIDKFLNKNRKWCIIKLSPLTTKKEIDMYYSKGFRQFHCCNTLPVKKGGLSGHCLIPYVANMIHYIKHNYKDTVVIAGGGIASFDTINFYKSLGADYFSLSSVMFNPFNFFFKSYYL